MEDRARARARALWERGDSLGEIAKELGCSIHDLFWLCEGQTGDPLADLRKEYKAVMDAERWAQAFTDTLLKALADGPLNRGVVREKAKFVAAEFFDEALRTHEKSGSAVPDRERLTKLLEVGEDLLSHMDTGRFTTEEFANELARARVHLADTRDEPVAEWLRAIVVLGPIDTAPLDAVAEAPIVIEVVDGQARLAKFRHGGPIDLKTYRGAR